MMSGMRRTTIFLSDELHEDLRLEAFRSRISMAQLIRSRLESRGPKKRQGNPKRDSLLAVAGICRGVAASSRDIDKDLYGI